MSLAKTNIAILLAAVFGIFSVSAQSAWRLKRDQNGIKIYMRDSEHSSFNEIKVEMMIQAKPSALAALLLDVPNHAKWVYNVRSATVLKRISAEECFFYEDINSPFPATDRDLVVHFKISQDSITKVVTVSAIDVPDYIPPKKNIVRVPVSNETWKVTPVANDKLRIEYFLQIDPGGSIPAWLINNFAEKGPYESFRHLQEQVDKPAYKNAVIPFIRN
jgi:hypothetical protein